MKKTTISFFTGKILNKAWDLLTSPWNKSPYPQTGDSNGKKAVITHKSGESGTMELTGNVSSQTKNTSIKIGEGGSIKIFNGSSIKQEN